MSGGGCFDVPIGSFVRSSRVRVFRRAGDFQYQQTTKITGGAMLSMLKMMSKFSGQMRQGSSR